MSPCLEFADLNAMVDCDLSTARELMIRQHLDLCSACLHGVEGMAALKRAVARAYGCDVPSPPLRRALTLAIRKRRGRRVARIR